MSSLEKRHNKLMEVWEEIHEILHKNNVSMDIYNGSIAIYDQNLINDDSIVIPRNIGNEINYNYDDTPF